MATRNAAGARRRTDLSNRAVGDVRAAPPSWDTLFASVGPKADAFEAADAIVAVDAQSILAADTRAVGLGHLAYGRFGRSAVGVHARNRARRVRLWTPGALGRAVAIDIFAARGNPSAIELELTRLMNPMAEAREPDRLADQAFRTIVVEKTRHAPVDARPTLTHEPGDTIEIRITARCGLDTSEALAAQVRANSIWTALGVGDAEACGSQRARLDRNAFVRRTARLDAVEPGGTIAAVPADDLISGTPRAKRAGLTHGNPRLAASSALTSGTTPTVAAR